MGDEIEEGLHSSRGPRGAHSTITIIRKGSVMKALSFALMLMASLGFVLLGCSDNSAPVAGPTDQAITSSSSVADLAKGGVLHSVTGSGHISLINGVTPYNERWAVNAIQHSTTEFSGEVSYHDWVAGFKFHGKIIDLKVDELAHQAKVGWILTRDNIPPEWGTFDYIFMVIQDNGKGENDWVSYAWGGSGLEGISLQDWIDMNPSAFMAELANRGATDLFVELHGNFTVR